MLSFSGLTLVGIALGVPVLGVLGYLFWRYLNQDPYSIGRRKGKRVVGTMKDQLLSILSSKASKRPLDERLKEVCERVFEVGFAFERAHYELEVRELDSQIKRIEEEVNTREKLLVNRYERGIEIARSEESVFKKRIEETESELAETQKKEAEKLQQLQKQNIRGEYFMAQLANNLRGLLRLSAKNFEIEVLRYGYALLVVLLLAGDFYITYSIFNDILKITIRGSVAIYVFSGVIALVFLVLAELFLEFLENQSLKNAKLTELVQRYSITIIGAIMIVAYLLIISVSLFPENNASRVIDAILRILFLPLITAAALMVRRIRKEFGFSFLLAPIKFIVFSIGLTLSYLVLPVEMIATSVHTKNKFRRSTTPIEKNILEVLTAERNKFASLEQDIAVQERKILSSKSRLENEILSMTLPFKQKREKAISHFKALKRGCDEAVFIQLGRA